MRTRTLIDALDLTAVTGAGTAVDLSDDPLPFAPNNTVVLCLESPDAASAAFKLEGSNDGGSSWADLEDTEGNVVMLDAAGVQFFEVTLPEQIRPNITDQGSAGTASVVALNN